MNPASIANRPAAHLDPAYPGARSDPPLIGAVRIGFIELIRGVPLVGVLFMGSVMFTLFLPERVTVDKLLCAILRIALVTGAYLEEALRGAYSPFRAGGGVRSLRLR